MLYASAYSMHACQRKGARAEQCEEKQHLRLWKSTALILGTRFLSHAYLLLIGHNAIAESLKMAELSR